MAHLNPGCLTHHAFTSMFSALFRDPRRGAIGNTATPATRAEAQRIDNLLIEVLDVLMEYKVGGITLPGTSHSSPLFFLFRFLSFPRSLVIASIHVFLSYTPSSLSSWHLTNLPPHLHPVRPTPSLAAQQRSSRSMTTSSASLHVDLARSGQALYSLIGSW